MLYGGELSTVNGTTIQIQSGQGIIVDLNKSDRRTQPRVTEVSWDTQQIVVQNLTPGNTNQLKYKSNIGTHRGPIKNSLKAAVLAKSIGLRV